MQRSPFGHNIYVDGDPYLKGFLGLSLFPSAEAKSNAANYETVLTHMIANLWAKFTNSRVIQHINQYPSRNVIIRPRAIPDPDQDAPPLQQVPEEERQYNATAEPTREKDAILRGEPAPARTRAAPARRSHPRSRTGSPPG